MVDDAEQTTEAAEPDVVEAPAESASATETTEATEASAATATEGGGDATDGTDRSSALNALEQEGEVAADYLEALLDILDLDGDLEIDIEGDRASVAIVGADLDNLVGQRGVTLEALQELTRLAVLQETGQRSRLMLDIGGYRQRRRTELVALAKAAGERVAGNGQEEKLAPMTPFERKVVHDTIAAIDGVASDSEGEEPQRRVVVRPA
ncbi:MAG TPA: R3H domain-containing nucleic acid-binding protein [Frankiaceae bacterium]|nr:R3H domain-containing nucleic acid-binding protein [Frankiaceae bacterium]